MLTARFLPPVGSIVSRRNALRLLDRPHHLRRSASSIGLIAGARSRTTQTLTGARDRRLPRPDGRLPAARPRARHQLGGNRGSRSVTLHDGVEIPQLGFGVFQVPPEDTQRGRRGGARPPATATSTPPPPTATRGASARRSPPPASPATRSSSPPSSGTPQQGFDSTLEAFEKSLERLGHRPRRPLPDPLAGADRRTSTSRPGAPSSRSTARAARARSASPTSASRTSSGSSREAETRADRQPDRAAPAPPAGASCAPGTPSTGSRPRPGARSARAQLLDEEAIVDDRRAPREDARPRRSCAGTCSSATSSSRSRSPRSGSARTSRSSTSS